MNIQEIQLFDDWFKSSRARRSEVNVRELEDLIQKLKPYKFDEDEINHLISFVRKNAQQFIEIRNK
jgi:Spy/CpxP family protein refolding chaperone